MRIAMVVPVFPAISETFILYQVTGLINLGHDVMIFSLRRPKQEPVHPAVQEYNLLECTTYLDLPTNQLVCLFQGLSSLLRLGLQEGRSALTSFALMQKKWGLPHRSDPVRTSKFHKLAQDCDIVHCHFGPTGKAMLPAKPLVDAPLLTTFHGYDVGRFVRKHGNGVYRDLFRHGDLFTANTKYTASRVHNLGCRESKIVVHHMGVVVDDFRFRERARVDGRPVRVITVGRLVEEKGMEYAIRAVGNLIDGGCDMQYDIVGDGYLRPALQGLLRQRGLTEKIRLWGARSRPQVAELLDAADIFVLSSISTPDGAAEGQGLVLQEAQACGLPVVSTLVGGIPEGVVDGESGLLVPERDVGALTDRLKYLVDNPQLWPEMGRRGRELVEEKFDIDKLNRRLVKIYEDVIAGRLPINDR